MDLATPQGPTTIPNDFVLAMTGYEPDFSFLANMGITWDETELQTPVYNEETHESNVPGIYLAGVICGGMQTNRFFIENARDHAEKIIGSISSAMPGPVINSER